MRRFLLDLFIQTGRHHPDETTLTGPQIQELMIHRGRLFPWGYSAVTRGEAMLWEVLVNVNRRQGSPPVRAEALLPKQPKRAQTWEEIERVLLSMGAKRVTKHGDAG